ncbi:MAG: ORF6N domain-containing protein [Bacteroidales bacterium]|nr:ORF6N domain-containing protein [Bacteroidales bacterium]
METTLQPQTILPIFQKIHEIRGQKVMLDFDLAELYDVETRILIQAVKRNVSRFPSDFMFQLTRKELNCIPKFQMQILNAQNSDFDTNTHSRSQIVILDDERLSNQTDIEKPNKRGTNIKYLPYAFTEQGIAMLSSVLRSDRAIEVNIAIMRVFVEMRKLFLNHQELLIKVGELAEKVGEHDQYIKTLYDYLKSYDEEQKRRIEWENRNPIGFVV